MCFGKVTVKKKIHVFQLTFLKNYGSYRWAKLFFFLNFYLGYTREIFGNKNFSAENLGSVPSALAETFFCCCLMIK